MKSSSAFARSPGRMLGYCGIETWKPLSDDLGRSSGDWSMVHEPNRRAVLLAAGAAAAASALPASPSTALDNPARPVYRTAGDLVAALAAREVSARELLDLAISRIEALDAKLIAVVVRDFDRARAAADAVAAPREDGRFSGSGDRHAPALPDREQRRQRTEQSHRTVSQARLSGGAREPEIARSGADNKDLFRAARRLLRYRSAA